MKVVMVHESVADTLVAKVHEKVKALTVGKPEDNCDICAVISEGSANWIEELVTGVLLARLCCRAQHGDTCTGPSTAAHQPQLVPVPQLYRRPIDKIICYNYTGRRPKMAVMVFLKQSVNNHTAHTTNVHSHMR